MPIEHTPIKEDDKTKHTQALDIARNLSRSAMDGEGSSHDIPDASEALSLNAASLVKLPPFWKDNPSLWFAQVEAAFAISRITSDETKFRYVILNIDTTALPLVSDIIATPPEQGKYNALKSRLIGSLDETSESKLRKLLR